MSAALREAACRRPAAGVALTTLVALLLALLSAGFALRAVLDAPTSGTTPYGLFGGQEGPRARALVARLASGLLSLQRADGGFDLGKDGEYSYLIERVASSALATATLASLQAEGPKAGLPEAQVVLWQEALDRGLNYLKKQQIETGAIGREEPQDHWSQVDATVASILAFALAGRPEDEQALRAAGLSLERFARAGLRNGWTRALGVMTLQRVAILGQDTLFARDPRSLVDVRELKQAPREGLPQASDWNVAEAISRVVLGLRKGVDPFPGRVVLACLEDKPVWGGQSSDCQAWWMQAWLVARSGSPEAAPWFMDLLKVLEEEAVEADNTIHGGWYANSLSQTAGGILALLEGLTTQVVSP